MSAELESENLRVTEFSGPLISLVTRRERIIFEFSQVHLELSPNSSSLPVGVTVTQDKTDGMEGDAREILTTDIFLKCCQFHCSGKDQIERD